MISTSSWKRWRTGSEPSEIQRRLRESIVFILLRSAQRHTGEYRTNKLEEDRGADYYGQNRVLVFWKAIAGEQGQVVRRTRRKSRDSPIGAEALI